MNRFIAATLDATPWKNGGGVTRTIVTSPAGSDLDSFAWRVSIAEVGSDGPFSRFAGVDRVLLLLAGNGVVLRAADGRMVHRLDEPFVPFAFDGGDQITASLIAGSSMDFNVMTRRGIVQADVRVMRERAALEALQGGVVFAARGRWALEARGIDATSLDEGEGTWWDGDFDEAAVKPRSPDAVLISVAIRRP